MTTLHKFIDNALKGALLFAAACCFSVAGADVRLPAWMADKMVIQRDRPIEISGWSDPGEKVTLRFRNSIYHAQGDPSGKWSVTLPPQSAGGPFLMEINDKAIRDVLVGDLWLFSGQSNQEQPMARFTDRYPEINTSDYNKIRHYKVPTNSTPYPQSDIKRGGKWSSGVASEVLDWTALAYFFAKQAYEATGVPQGIIVSSLGGSSIEAWMDPEHLAALKPDMQPLADMIANAADKGAGLYSRPDYDDSGWAKMNVPGFWKDAGLNHKGSVWYRKKIDIPAGMAGLHSRLILGTLVDSDSAFVNGRCVGTTGYQYPPRKYNIPAGVLKEGENVIAVKITDNGGFGGFTPDKDYMLVCDGDTISLEGEWRYAPGKTAGNAERLAGVFSQPTTAVSGLYHGMILPLAGTSFKGAVWYQGESDAWQHKLYGAMLKDMMATWREALGDQDLPFIVVQLPNFMQKDENPGNGDWAFLREAQQYATRETPRARMTVNYDLGEWNDIHPQNKKDVADRIWRSAAEHIYADRRVEGDSPEFDSMTVSGDKITIKFKNTGRGLRTRDGAAPRHFAIAGEDGKFRWATATLKGDRVILSAPGVTNPVAVRYAWGNNPEEANLISIDGLPAAPFRTDGK